MADIDDNTRAMFKRIYERFNARDIDAVLARTVAPQAFSTLPDGRIDITVHQVVKSLDGDLLQDATGHHVYRLRDDRVEHMEIRDQ